MTDFINVISKYSLFHPYCSKSSKRFVPKRPFLLGQTIPLSIQKLIIVCLLVHHLILFDGLQSRLLFVNPRDPLPKIPNISGLPWPLPRYFIVDEKTKLTINPETVKISSNLQCDVLEHAFERYANLMFINDSIKLEPTLPQIVNINVLVRSKECDRYPHPNTDESYEIRFVKYFDITNAQNHHDQQPNDNLFDKNNNNVIYDSSPLNTSPYSSIRVRKSPPISYGGSQQRPSNFLGISDIYEIRILSATIWGSLRGLETISQILTITTNQTYVMKKMTISDAPRYKHRGLLIDTARHYMPLTTLKNILDAMSYNKLNVFHWHIVDDQSFPYESKLFPELSQKGAFSPQHIYKVEDVIDIIEYARMRGIRVIPEFDTPGHTYSWGKSHPEVLTSCYGNGRDPNTPRFPHHSARENLDPLNPKTYQMVTSLFREIFTIFPDPYFHAGMDETFPACWLSNPYIQNLTSSQHLDPYKIAFSLYMNKTLDIINRLGKRAIIWEDPVEDSIKVPNHVILQVWKNWGRISLGLKLANYVADGHDLIISAPWYLDDALSKEDWQRFYSYDPEKSIDLEPDQKNGILGGEACMWSEYVDPTSISETIWPRACAVAERLWSPKYIRRIDHAEQRLDEQRCRMIKRGIDVRPIKPGYCGNYEIRLGTLTYNTAPFQEDKQWIVVQS